MDSPKPGGNSEHPANAKRLGVRQPSGALEWAAKERKEHKNIPSPIGWEKVAEGRMRESFHAHWVLLWLILLQNKSAIRNRQSKIEFACPCGIFGMDDRSKWGLN